jgi:putative cell surface protein
LTLSSVSTFTSCKDYDDDINSLQEQVNKAALSSDVEALRTQVNNAATSAQNAATKAEEALTKAGANATEIATVKALATKNGTDVAKALTDAANAATAASNAATAASNAADAAKTAQDSANAALTKIAGLDKELKNLALNAQSHVTATQLKNSLDSLSDVINQATSDSIANLTKIVNGYKGGINALYTAVTEVSLMGSWNSNNGTGNSIFNGDCNLWFQTGTIGTNYTFGAKEKDDKNGEHSADPKKSYVKDASINFPSEFLVRVNPVNAKITPDMIKLIDSKGNDLDKLVKVVDVEKYDNLLTSRASETGLWTVKVQLQDGVKKENVAQRAENGQNILYAVAVNNTASQAETVADAASRYVVSTYDLTVRGAYDYQGATDLGAVKVKAESKDWKTVSSLKPNPGTGATDLVYAANGENVLVSFENLSNVDRFYVVRDDKHADESGSSELNAWKSYEYQGLNEVVAVENGNGKATLNIKINGQVGDEVQFRIFAVNYDGTLVEQKGRPFRVYVGAQSTTTSVAGNLVATGKETMETGWLPISGSLKNGAALPSTVWVTVNNVKIEANVEYAKDNEGHSAADNSKIKFAKFSVAAADLTKWADGATATGTIKDNANVTVNTISVSLTKVMPTAETTKALMKYSWKDNQLNNGVYTAYLYPAADAWTTANVATGYKDMNQAINGLNTNFVISIANAVLKAENGKNYYKNALNVTATPWKVEVNNAKDDAGVALIDNETKHETTIGYNYGKISSVKPTEDYIVNVETVQTVFACPLNTAAQTYAWAQVPAVYGTNGQVVTPAKDVNVLTYGNEETVITNIFDCLVAHNSFDNTVFGGKLSERYNKYVNIDAKLISNGSKLEDYYKAKVVGGAITFHQQSAATNPTADVASTLVLTMTDAFGHENVYELPFTVKRAK